MVFKYTAHSGLKQIAVASAMTLLFITPLSALADVKISQIKAKAGVFDGQEFEYTLSWKAKAPVTEDGSDQLISIEVSEKSNPDEVVFSEESAGLVDSQDFTVKPKTKYVVSVFDQPEGSDGDGKIIKKLAFTSKKAPKNSSGNPTPTPNPKVTAVPTPFPTSNNYSGGGYSPSYQTSGGTADLASLGTLVGPGTVSTFARNCDEALLASSAYAYQTIGQPNNPPTDVSCKTINKLWVSGFSFKRADGKCYTTDWNGTYLIDCSVLQSKIGFPPQLLVGDVPTNGWDTNVNWEAYNAKCRYTAGDRVQNTYGSNSEAFCGVNTHNMSASAPTPDQILGADYSNSIPSRDKKFLNELASAYYSDASAIDYLGEYVGAGTASGFAASSNQACLTNSPAASRQDNPANPPADAVCRTTGKFWVANFDWKSPNGLCYHANWNGTFKLDCALLEKILGFSPTIYSKAKPPTSGFDTSLNFNDYNGRCIHSVKDNGGDMYFGACGVDTHNPAPTPTPSSGGRAAR